MRPYQDSPGPTRTSPGPRQDLTRPHQALRSLTRLQQNLTRLHQASKGPPQDLMRLHQGLTMPPQDLPRTSPGFTRTSSRPPQDYPGPYWASPGPTSPGLHMPPQASPRPSGPCCLFSVHSYCPSGAVLQPRFTLHSSRHMCFTSSGAWSMLFPLLEAFPSLYLPTPMGLSGFGLKATSLESPFLTHNPMTHSSHLIFFSQGTAVSSVPSLHLPQLVNLFFRMCLFFNTPSLPAASRWVGLVGETRAWGSMAIWDSCRLYY